MSAASSFSGWLVVITRTLPSWDATPVLEISIKLFGYLGDLGEGEKRIGQGREKRTINNI